MTNEERVSAPVDLAAVEARMAVRHPLTHTVLSVDEIRALTKALRIAVEALNSMAAFDDNAAEARMAITGTYSSFDEPCAVEESRDALRAISALVVIR